MFGNSLLQKFVALFSATLDVSCEPPPGARSEVLAEPAYPERNNLLDPVRFDPGQDRVARPRGMVHFLSMEQVEPVPMLSIIRIVD
jgi:hypothetical protein